MNRICPVIGMLLLLAWAPGLVDSAPLPEPPLKDDAKNIEGLWFLAPSEKRGLTLLRFHRGQMHVLDFPEDGSLVSTAPAYELRQRERFRVICRKGETGDREYIKYQLDGDKLILDDESPEKLVSFNLKGEWRRVK